VRYARHRLFAQHFHEPAAGQRIFNQKPVTKMWVTHRKKQYREPAGQALAAEYDQRLGQRVDAIAQTEGW